MLEITEALVRRLLVAQAPQWAHLSIRPVLPGGHDNRTFRLGPNLSIRLPSAEGYAPQATKEHEWLPRLAPSLPFQVPRSVFLGVPSDDFPWPWSVRGWIDGEPLAEVMQEVDELALAHDIAAFLRALGSTNPVGGPAAGSQSFHRGGSLMVYDQEARAVLSRLQDQIDFDAALRVWEQALASTWSHPPVWVHGDVAVGNLVLRNGRLAAVIDFGSSAVGDPACDLVPAWTIFSEAAGALFREQLPYDAGTWERARGWALWKAAITVDGHRTGAVAAARVLHRVMS